MAQSLGIVDLYFKGRKIEVENGARFNPGGIENDVAAVGRRVFTSQKLVAGQVTATTVLEAGASITWLLDPSPGELQFKCDTGQTYTIPDAVRTRMPGITGGNGGKMELEFGGSPAQELLS